MCRIFGIIYGPGGAEAEPWSPTEFGQILFPALVRRGPHAYGWMSYNGNSEEEIDVAKFYGRSDSREAQREIEIDPEAKWVIGHTRYATLGSPSNMANNHPLFHGDIVGVHNGEVDNYEQILSVTGRENPDTEVDSEAIFAAVDKWGVVDGLKHIQSRAMACVFTSMLDLDTVYLVHGEGSHKNLNIAYTPAGSLIFASEEAALGMLHMELKHVGPLKRNRVLEVRRGRVQRRVSYTPYFVPPLYRSSSVDSWRNWAATPGSPPPRVRSITDHFLKEPTAEFLEENKQRSEIPIDGLYYHNGKLLNELELEQEMEAEANE